MAKRLAEIPLVAFIAQSDVQLVAPDLVVAESLDPLLRGDGFRFRRGGGDGRRGLRGGGRKDLSKKGERALALVV